MAKRLLLENGAFLLLEGGGRLLLEEAAPDPVMLATPVLFGHGHARPQRIQLFGHAMGTSSPMPGHAAGHLGISAGATGELSGLIGAAIGSVFDDIEALLFLDE